MDSEFQIASTLSFDEKFKRAREHLASINNGKRRGAFSLPRSHFDPSDRVHLESYNTFLKTGSWGEILFYQEFPFDSVIETVTRKFALNALEQIIKLGV